MATVVALIGGACGSDSGGTAIAAGAAFTCALVKGGTVRCWGNNIYGALGDGTNTNSNTPVDTVGIP